MAETKNQVKEGEGVRMIDMHAHFFCIEREESVAEELRLRLADGLRTFISCGTPEEWEKTKGLRSREEVYVSFGIHPWYADRYDAEEYTELFQMCDAIGEIGMDNVWCEVPHEIQRRQLEQQLDMAASLGKAVILHTKGREKEIVQMIRDFPNPVCVHWYSGDIDTFEQFLELGCYFTLGPDFAQLCKAADMRRINTADGTHKTADASGIAGKAADTTGGTYKTADASGIAGKAADMAEGRSQTADSVPKELKSDFNWEQARLYGRMAREIPLDRLFLETDGISAVAWALGSEYTGLDQISQVLWENARYLAEIRNIEEETLCRRMEQNLNEFLNFGKS